MPDLCGHKLDGHVCNRLIGHDGLHSETKNERRLFWQDPPPPVACDVENPHNGLTCTRDMGHDGDHSATDVDGNVLSVWGLGATTTMEGNAVVDPAFPSAEAWAALPEVGSLHIDDAGSGSTTLYVKTAVGPKEPCPARLGDGTECHLPRGHSGPHQGETIVAWYTEVVE